MRFTDNEKTLARKLKESGLRWEPAEGDWFWSPEDHNHKFYLGESLPSSYAFVKGEAYVFDAAMTWHIQQGGMDMGRFVWLPSWEQCREYMKEKGYSLSLTERGGAVHLEARREGKTLTADGGTDLEAFYALIPESLKKD